MLLNQKGAGQREAVYLTLDLQLWSLIPQTPALGKLHSLLPLSDWSAPRPSRPLHNEAILYTMGQIQSSLSLNIFKKQFSLWMVKTVAVEIE